MARPPLRRQRWMSLEQGGQRHQILRRRVKTFAIGCPCRVNLAGGERSQRPGPGFRVQWNYLMAASLITTVIVLALFMTVQQHLTRGLLGAG